MSWDYNSASVSPYERACACRFTFKVFPMFIPLEETKPTRFQLRKEGRGFLLSPLGRGADGVKHSFQPKYFSSERAVPAYLKKQGIFIFEIEREMNGKSFVETWGYFGRKLKRFKGAMNSRPVKRQLDRMIAKMPLISSQATRRERVKRKFKSALGTLGALGVMEAFSQFGEAEATPGVEEISSPSSTKFEVKKIVTSGGQMLLIAETDNSVTVFAKQYNGAWSQWAKQFTVLGASEVKVGSAISISGPSDVYVALNIKNAADGRWGSAYLTLQKSIGGTSMLPKSITLGDHISTTDGVGQAGGGQFYVAQHAVGGQAQIALFKKQGLMISAAATIKENGVDIEPGTISKANNIVSLPATAPDGEARLYEVDSTTMALRKAVAFNTGQGSVFTISKVFMNPLGLDKFFAVGTREIAGQKSGVFMELDLTLSPTKAFTYAASSGDDVTFEDVRLDTTTGEFHISATKGDVSQASGAKATSITLDQNATLLAESTVGHPQSSLKGGAITQLLSASGTEVESVAVATKTADCSSSVLVTTALNGSLPDCASSEGITQTDILSSVSSRTVTPILTDVTANVTSGLMPESATDVTVVGNALCPGGGSGATSLSTGFVPACIPDPTTGFDTTTVGSAAATTIAGTTAVGSTTAAGGTTAAAAAGTTATVLSTLSTALMTAMGSSGDTTSTGGAGGTTSLAPQEETTAESENSDVDLLTMLIAAGGAVFVFCLGIAATKFYYSRRMKRDVSLGDIETSTSVSEDGSVSDDDKPYAKTPVNVPAPVVEGGEETYGKTPADVGSFLGGGENKLEAYGKTPVVKPAQDGEDAYAKTPVVRPAQGGEDAYAKTPVVRPAQGGEDAYAKTPVVGPAQGGDDAYAKTPVVGPAQGGEDAYAKTPVVGPAQDGEDAYARTPAGVPAMMGAKGGSDDYGKTPASVGKREKGRLGGSSDAQRQRLQRLHRLHRPEKDNHRIANGGDSQIVKLPVAETFIPS
jgi:hypothetical protein